MRSELVKQRWFTFHVFNVSLSHLRGKQVLVWYWLWQAVASGILWQFLQRHGSGHTVQSFMEAERLHPRRQITSDVCHVNANGQEGPAPIRVNHFNHKPPEILENGRTLIGYFLEGKDQKIVASMFAPPPSPKRPFPRQTWTLKPGICVAWE